MRELQVISAVFSVAPNSQARTGTGEYYFPCSADHEQDWQPYPVDPYSAICDDHTYIHTYIRTVAFTHPSILRSDPTDCTAPSFFLFRGTAWRRTPLRGFAPFPEPACRVFGTACCPRLFAELRWFRSAIAPTAGRVHFPLRASELWRNTVDKERRVQSWRLEKGMCDGGFVRAEKATYSRHADQASYSRYSRQKEYQSCPEFKLIE